MIVRDAPYDWVMLFADADTQRFVEQLVLRGQERQCLSRRRVRSIRDPKRDVVWRDPLLLLRPPIAIPGVHKVLVCWDLDGSGGRLAAEAEEQVVTALQQAGFARDDVCAACFAPELEAVLAAVHTLALQLFADRRRMAPPSEAQILARLQSTHDVVAASHADALARFPKEWLSASLALLRLKRAPDIYEDLGKKLSLPALKTHALAERIATTMQRWG